MHTLNDYMEMSYRMEIIEDTEEARNVCAERGRADRVAGG